MQMVRNTVDIKEDFGGVNIQFENGLEKELVISVLTPDSLGDWMEAETWYTSQEEGSFSIRGFEAKPRKFAVFVRDEWENLSDTLIVERVPLYERSEEHTSELQSLMRISYAVFCLKKKIKTTHNSR